MAIQQRVLRKSSSGRLLALFLLSSASLTFEISLTRLFSVVQFYHFAFLIVSLALLGYGASGTFLAIFPGIGSRFPGRTTRFLALAASLAILVSYLLTNLIPFDSFQIAWDLKQAGIFFLHDLLLTSPFFFCGMLVSFLFTVQPETSHLTYAVNLAGAALGCILVLFTPQWLGEDGMVLLCSATAALAAVFVRPEKSSGEKPSRLKTFAQTVLPPGLAILILLYTVCGMTAKILGSPVLAWLSPELSPYKGISYALQIPGSSIISQRNNSFSRVDVVQSSGIRSLPGLSYRYLNPPPAEDGLFVDGDDLSPILNPAGGLEFAAYMPQSIVFQLRPQAETLILEPRGGLDVLIASTSGAGQITAVEANPLISEAAHAIYQMPGVSTQIETGRTFLNRSETSYDVILLSLVSGYHPIRSGAFSLTEDYALTVEAFSDILHRLKPDGIFFTSRWLQMPPSESLRLFTTAVTALEKNGLDPAPRIVAIRGYNIASFLIKTRPFSSEELSQIRQFTRTCAFDLIYAPDLKPEETNQYNILSEPIYTSTYIHFLNTLPRETFYTSYPYEVSPPTDDRPFFHHFFKWSQTKQILTELGKTWQPFGGAGYFVILITLAATCILAAVLIFLPLCIKTSGPKNSGSKRQRLPISPRIAVYFGGIGLAYLFVEIPLIQRFILYLGQPAYSMTMVLFSLLIFSSLGSRISQRIPTRLALPGLFLLLLIFPWLLTFLFDLTIKYSLAVRMLLTVLMLAPVGVLMGIPFPTGMSAVGKLYGSPASIAWVWAVNGSASVISSILAALLALSLGFTWIFHLGAACYALAWLMSASEFRGGFLNSFSSKWHKKNLA